MTPYTLLDLNIAVQGQAFGNTAIVVESLSTNSRTVFNPEGVVFFAIPGKNHDGHIYIEALIEKGVKAFVVSDPVFIRQTKDCGFILTDNVVLALQKIAAIHRSKFNIPLIGITGSNGKTIVKEWLNYLLSSQLRVTRSPKSFNSQIGVPLSVWQLSEKSDIGIFEAGISMPGEMDNLEKIIHPDIGVFTNLGNAHQKNFKSLHDKASEKAKLFRNAGTIVWCADDPTIDGVIPRDSNRKLLSWSFSNKGAIKALVSQNTESCSVIEIKSKSETYLFRINYTDKASIENAITCFICCMALHCDLHSLIPLFSSLPIVEMRLEMIDGRNSCRIINDSYSLDINSFEIALDNLVSHAANKDTILIISDFQQSHLPESELYTAVSRMVIAHRITRIIAIGKIISKNKSLFPPETAFFEDTKQFIDSSLWMTFRNSEILIKGARSFCFENIVSLLQKQTHETVFEINLNAVESNLNYFRQISGKKVKTMVMVKAFSYGTGYFEIAGFLQYLKVDYLAVAYIDEGIDLRRACISMPIMVINPRREAYDKMFEYSLEPEIYSLGMFEDCIHAIKTHGLRKYPVHLKLDTGMHRLGFSENDIEPLQFLIEGNREYLKIQSVFTHLVGADDPKHDEFTHKQVAGFSSMASRLADDGCIQHVLNSSGIIRFPQYCFDMVRIGIGLYGFAAGTSYLINTGTLKTTISQIRQVEQGETIGYNRHGKVMRKSLIATIPVGYADGFNRHLGNGKWQVIINNQKAPVIGDVCMDMTMIDVTGLNVKQGDEVIVFGSEMPVTEMAKVLGTIPYEILTGISQRVKRVYYQE